MRSCLCTFKFKVVLGTFALWFGWYGFNPGSTLTMKSGADGALAAQVAMNTTLAAATGGITVFLLRYVITHKYLAGGMEHVLFFQILGISSSYIIDISEGVKPPTRYDVGALCNGILASLVSITAGCGNMESGSAFATGLIGGGFSQTTGARKCAGWSSFSSLKLEYFNIIISCFSHDVSSFNASFHGETWRLCVPGSINAAPKAPH